MSKLYRVMNNENVEEYGVCVGDICTLLEYDKLHETAWFRSDKWLDDGVWCLSLTQVEEIIEEIDVKGLDSIYDKFENLILFLEAEVNNVEDCDEFTEAKKALKSLSKVIETN